MPSDFVTKGLKGVLREAEGRRQAIKPAYVEYTELEKDIKELRKQIGKREGQAGTAEARDADGPLAPQPQPRDPNQPTNADRVIEVLKEFPMGLSVTDIARKAEMPPNSTGAIMDKLMKKGSVTRLGRGFYRLARQNEAASAEG